MKKKVKKTLNGLVALMVAQIPLFFPADIIMLGVFILGIVTIAIAVYCLMETINH